MAVDSQDAQPNLANANWISPSDGKFTFANLPHGWYRAAVRDSQGNICMSEALYIDGGLKLIVTDDAENRALSILANSFEDLVALSVNGYSILEAGNACTFDYLLGGDYTVYAKNASGRTASITVSTSVALTMDDDALTTTTCSKYGVQDASVTVSLSSIHGGTYDKNTSQPAWNSYHAVYTAALVTVSGQDTEPDQSALEQASRITSSNGQFVFEGLAHGWYCVVIQDSQGNICMSETFYLDGGLSLTVTDDAENHVLIITAGSFEEMTALTVNGYDIMGSTTFDYTLGGAYTVYAANSAGRTAEITVNAEVPLTLDDRAVYAEKCTPDHGGKNGSVTVKQSGVYGGNYDPDASQPHQNLYQAIYTATLLPVSGPNADPDANDLSQAEWITAEKGEYRFKNLAFGWYQLIIRDSQGNRISKNIRVNMENPDTGSDNVKIEQPEHGTIIVTPENPNSGEDVTIIAKPDDGYTLGELTVTDEDGKEVDLIQSADGSYVFTMPDGSVTIQATFVLIAFRDVTWSDYYYDAVLWAVENGITIGTGDGIFSPDMKCTRAQAVTFLWRAAGSPAPVNSDMPFTDVAPGSYYYDAVLWAVENDITKGTDSTTFSPDMACTRAQIVTFLWRSQSAPVVYASNPFEDVTATAYYADAVLWAVENGITKGTSDISFSPEAICTRAQIVTFLYRNQNSSIAQAEIKEVPRTLNPASQQNMLYY